MKQTLLIIGLILSLTGFSQGVVYEVDGSGGGISALDSTVTLGILPTDATPTAVVSGEAGLLKKISTVSVNFGHSIASYSTGSVYTLTNSSAFINFGTTDPSIVLDEIGTYLILSGANAKLNAATFAANQTITCKLRRTNNTAADITNGAETVTLPIVTTTTNHAGTFNMPAVIYTTTNTDDIIQMWGTVSTAPSAGTVSIQYAYLIAIKLY
jgi:hypothetical protein